MRMTWKCLWLTVVGLVGCGGSTATDFSAIDDGGGVVPDVQTTTMPDAGMQVPETGQPVEASNGQCVNSRDCPANQVCDPSSMACVQCVTPTDCPAGQSCVGSHCVAPAPVCKSNDGCAADPAHPICNVPSGKCVACLVPADCGKGDDCVDNACKPPMPCVNSLNCPMGRVCDVMLGHCVQCVGNADCAMTDRCVDGTCRMACTSDNNCKPMGLLCNVARGVCVSCVNSSDCKPEQNCSNGTCVADVCTAGSSTCQSNAVATCNVDGSGFGAPAACGPKQSCAQAGNAATCKDQICTPSVVSCSSVAEQVLKCAADGLGSTVQSDCGASGQVCVAGQCAPVVCTAGQRYCQGLDLRQCSPKGDSSMVVQTCMASEYCDGVTKGCKAKLCTPNAPVCNLNVATTCNADGSGYAAGGIDCSPQFCSGGSCISVLFQEDFEDGNYDGWTVGTGSYTRSVVTTTAAAGTLHSMYLNRTVSSGADDGIYYLLPSAVAPSSISYWAEATGGYAYLDLSSSSNVTNRIFRLFSSGGYFYVYDGASSYSTGILANQWRHIELRNINWIARSFDLYIDGALIRPGTKFGATGSVIARIDLFVYDTASYGYWDQIEFFP